MLNDGMLRQDPWATSPSIESTIAGRWNASTSFDATIPITPRCQPSPATTMTEREPTSRSVSTTLRACGDDVGFLLLAPEILRVELLGQPARFVGHRLVGGQQQSRGDIWRAHAAGGIDAGSEHEADVIAVDLLAGEAADVEQRTQPDLVRTLRQHGEAELGDDPVFARQRNDVGQRPDRRHLHERRHPVTAARSRTERLHQLECDADAGEVLVGICCSRGASG